MDDIPLIFVPGFMASSLHQPPRFNLLLPQTAWPPDLYTLTSQLTLLEESYPLQARSLVAGYYQKLLAFITRAFVDGGLGRTLDQDFWIFAYDWRQSNRLSGRQLQKFIVDKLATANARRIANGQTPWHTVDIINHSMGGLVTRVAFANFAAPINRVVYLASGDYGIPKAFFALHPDTVSKLVDEFVRDFLPGWYWDLLKSFPNVWLLQNWLVRILGTFQSMYELLPDEFYLSETHSLLTDTAGQLVLGVADTYFNQPWHLSPNQQSRVKQAMRLKAELGPNLPGHKNLLIYNDSLPTYTHAHYDKRLEFPLPSNSGDGTVVAHSISRDSRARRVIVEGRHSQLPELSVTHNTIRTFLQPTSI